MLYINTGNGKGKSTAAMGQILRSMGHGWKVCLVQLFKGKDFYGEQKTFNKFKKQLDFYSFAPKHPGCFPKTDRKLVRKQCLEAVDCIHKLLTGKKRYDLLVLEEFNIALRDGFLELKEVLDIINKYYNLSDIIITGRCAPEQLIARADMVTEMKEIKHPYRKGLKSRKGIEY
jgi:cob(I)alamin adenosyltransferase